MVVRGILSLSRHKAVPTVQVWFNSQNTISRRFWTWRESANPSVPAIIRLNYLPVRILKLFLLWLPNSSSKSLSNMIHSVYIDLFIPCIIFEWGELTKIWGRFNSHLKEHAWCKRENKNPFPVRNGRDLITYSSF